MSAVERPGAEPVARLAVSDTGVGIPAGEQGNLFTRFFRASTAQRNAVPGVGLGLTITKAITTAHGGTLDVVSAEGEGTRFTVTLRSSASHRGQEPSPRELSRCPGSRREPSRPHTALPRGALRATPPPCPPPRPRLFRSLVFLRFCCG